MSRKPDIPQGVKDEVIAFRRTGLSTYEISRETGISVASVYRIIKAAEVELPERAALTKEQTAEVIDRYLDNEPVDMIRRYFGLSLSAFYHLIDEAGVPRRSDTYLASRKEALDDAIVMYQQGKRIWEIKNATGIAASTLTNELHRRGIATRRSYIRPALHLNKVYTTDEVQADLAANKDDSKQSASEGSAAV